MRQTVERRNFEFLLFWGRYDCKYVKIYINSKKRVIFNYFPDIGFSKKQSRYVHMVNISRRFLRNFEFLAQSFFIEGEMVV